MLIKSLKLTNFLSFGSDSETVELHPLNVFIGSNGSGKSNLIEAIKLLHRTPSTTLAQAIRTGGGVGEYIWKGVGRASKIGSKNGSGIDDTGGSGSNDGRGLKTTHAATLEALLAFRPSKDPERDVNLRHRISFAAVGQGFEIIDERIENERPSPGKKKPFLYFGYEKGRPMVNSRQEEGSRALKRQNIHPEQSILAQFKDPEKYPELSFISNGYEDIAIHCDWIFGSESPMRAGQPTDQRTDRLSEGGRNAALILSRSRLDPSTKQRQVEAIKKIFEGAVDYSPSFWANTVEIYLEEASGWSTPATRLSDGTLRWLWLLAVLLDPKPPRLVCIEEPELGLHPDLIPTLARLLKDASERMQIIATTHSEVLIDALSDSPEDVIVCEREDGATTMGRLDGENLTEWLKRYRLGQLWSKGIVGGNRW